MKQPLISVFLLTLALTCGFGRALAQANAAEHHRRAVEFHDRRCLNDASREYAKTLELDPPRDLTAEEWNLAKRFAPRLYTTPTEFFPLKDFAVVLHPVDRLIAYHFFWEDDIDFPEDNDPCDHELIWVQYSQDRRSIEKVWTYFHGRILEGGEAALSDARRNAGRPRINVQWGKHGSLLAGWEQMKLSNEESFRVLSTKGRRLPEHPLAKRLGWPLKFAGRWEDFVDYSRLLDPIAMLEKTKMAQVSRWSSATINQHFLPYNFRPKTEWPVSELKSEISTFKFEISDLQLPAKTVFDRSMPRYPNVWFYVDARLASTYDAAVKLVTEGLRQSMRMRESYGPFSNPEGCDFEATIEHLQPWQEREHRALQHSHAFHIRYYFSSLSKHGLEQVRLKTPKGERVYFRVAASAHYEVEHTNPNHADVEICPICGRTGEYKDLKGNLVELVHDPLGVELVLRGEIRKTKVKFEDWEQREVGGIDGLKEKFDIQQVEFQAMTGDKNTLRIGVVLLAPR
jgi:hypothetical protein